MSVQTALKGSVQSLDTLRRVLLERRDAQHPPTPWREIARSYPGVPAGTLCAIAKGREPHKASVRAALGLPVLAAAPVCPVHGVVHARACRVVPEWVKAGADWLAARQGVGR